MVWTDFCVRRCLRPAGLCGFVAGQLVEQFDGEVGDSFARPDLGIAVQAHPGLVTPQGMPLAVGEIADPIVGQLGNVRVLEGRAFLMSSPSP